MALRLCLLVAGAVLAGCASGPLLVPVSTACGATVPERPAMPTEQFKAKPDLDALLQGALAEIEIREGYEIELRAGLEACTKPVAP